MPPLTRRPPNPRTRILALAADLTEDLAAVELDAIDGEFYWRCCRGDLLNAVEALRAEGPRQVGFDPDDPSRREEPEDLFDYLRQGLRFADDVLVLADRMAQLYPAVVWRRLLDGERVAMRAAEAELRRPTGDGAVGPPTLLLKVFSGAWTGTQVEDEVRRLVAARPEWFAADLPDHGFGPNAKPAMAVRVDFSFGYAHQATEEAPDDGPRPLPYVAVAIPAPLPPPQTIAREYDALVRGALKWHDALPGGGSRQEKVVAIRTWAIGLLMARGDRFGDAMDVVARRAGLTEVSQARFNQDRQKLIERVPEAEPYVFVKGQGSIPTRAVAPPAVANRSEPQFPLQAPEPETGTYT